MEPESPREINRLRCVFLCLSVVFLCFALYAIFMEIVMEGYVADLVFLFSSSGLSMMFYAKICDIM